MNATLDKTTLDILDTKSFLADTKNTMKIDPLEKGIPKSFLLFCEKFGDSIGLRTLTFGSSTKRIHLDIPGRKPYRRKTTTPEPVCYFSTEDFYINLHYEKDVVDLHIMEVTKSGRGLGTELMNKLLDVADEIDMKIKLIPVAYKSSGTPRFVKDCIRLKRFYMDFGFVPNKLTPYLIYTPKK